MGKTRTAVISGAPDEKASGKTRYEEKRKKLKERLEKEAKKKKQVTKVGLKGGERIKVVAAEPLPEKPKKEEEKEAKLIQKPKVRGKKYKDARSKVDKTKLYPIADAVKLAKETSYSSFDGSVDLHLVIKKEGQSYQVKLPHSCGKKKKIELADEKTIENLEKGKINFDVLLATPEMMPKLVPFAKILGPKGFMPNPKNGTLIKDKSEAKKFSGNTVTLKTERKAPLIHTTVGKVSQKDKEIIRRIR